MMYNCRKILSLFSCISVISFSLCAETDVRIPQALSSRRKLVDKIVSRVNGRNILFSDLTRPLITRGGAALVAMQDIVGGNHKMYEIGLSQAIDEQLLLARALERKIMPTPQEVEKQVISFKKRNGLDKLTEDEFNAELAKEGLDAVSYRRQLQRAIGIENVRHAESSERLVVTLSEKQAYYKQNPKFSEERFTLKIATFTAAQLGFPKSVSKKELLARKDIVWQELPSLAKSKIGVELASVFNLKQGEISQPINRDSRYQLVMLVKHEDGRYLTFEEQEIQIEQAIMEQKSERFMKELMADLRAKATVVHL